MKPGDQPSSSGLSRPFTRSVSSKQMKQQLDEQASSDKEFRTVTARKSQRRRETPRHLDDYVTYSAITQEGEPKSYSEAISCSESQQWKRAMDEEYSSIVKNHTWELCSLPAGQSVVGSKWIYKKKRSADGSTRYKARLVARGFSQRKGVNYTETYSPVVRFTSLRLLFAYAVNKGLDIYHLDIETAFLHGDMTDTVYLQQPEEYSSDENQVCLLKKAIYGLKQGSRNWNQKLDGALKDLKLIQSRLDSCIYSFYTTTKIIIVALFVDDLIVFTNSIDFKQILKEGLLKICAVKDLGPLKRCLGINVHYDTTKGVIELDQIDYINSLLKNFGMEDCRSVSTPMEATGPINKSPTSQASFDAALIPYQNVVGALLYLVQATRPDLAHAVGEISQFNINFEEIHWCMVKRVLRYVQGSKDFKLRYTRNQDSKITGYCDASWAGDQNDRRSTSGYVFIAQGGAVSWNSRRQNTVALSSTEAEYLSLSAAVQEAL